VNSKMANQFSNTFALLAVTDGGALRTQTSRLDPATPTPKIICVIADIMVSRIEVSAQGCRSQL
jgi:hypothetical protein